MRPTRRQRESWSHLETDTAVVAIGDRRLAITTCRGAAPEAWWRDLWHAEELERLAPAAEQLEAMAPDARDRVVRKILDDGSSGGGSLLMKYIKHHQRQDPRDWPAGLRVAVLAALARSGHERRARSV